VDKNGSFPGEISCDYDWRAIFMMSAKAASPPEQIDLFLPYLSDLSLRDQREMMERPFFSLAKSKRLKPIDYTSPDGKTWVHVSPNPDYGMATIWDADILIYCASMLNDMKGRGINDIPRVINIMPYDLLRAIGRPTTGRSYELLAGSLDRLQSTTVKTNIRADHRREATFSWLDSWSQLVDEKTERSRGMQLALSGWFYDGVLMSGGVLAIDRAYFNITGGRERWLYKVARKHAGGAGEGGFAIALPTLFEKSGAEGPYRRFKFEIAAIAKRNEVPGYTLFFEKAVSAKEPLLRMTRVVDAIPEAIQATKASVASKASAKSEAFSKPKTYSQGLTSREAAGYITDETLNHLRQHYRGWDFHALHEDFKAWLHGDETRTPANYQKAFIGYVKRYHERNRFNL
jgi:plasmid replication initiation protein